MLKNEIYPYSYEAVYVFTYGRRKVCQIPPAKTKPINSGRGGESIIHAASLTSIPPQRDTETQRYISGIVTVFGLY